MHRILICLLVVPSVLFAGENLSLACKGILLNQFQLENDGDFHVVESPDYLESFVFINGVLQRRIGNLRCDWSKQEIICMEFAKRITKDTSIVRTVNINRITGAVQSIQSAHGKDGKAFSVLEFNGNCTKQSSKF